MTYCSGYWAVTADKYQKSSKVRESRMVKHRLKVRIIEQCILTLLNPISDEGDEAKMPSSYSLQDKSRHKNLLSSNELDFEANFFPNINLFTHENFRLLR